MSLDSVKEYLKSFKNKLNADSLTFYVRDPFWPDELRLVAMPGVKLKEPMYGFAVSSFPSKFPDENDIEIRNFSTTDSVSNGGPGFSLNQIDQDKRFLFGGFIRREGVRSSAKMVHKADNCIEAMLYINYGKPKEFDESLKTDIRILFRHLIEDLPTIKKDLLALDAENIRRTIQIFSSISAGSKKLTYEWDQPWETYLNSLLMILRENLPELKGEKGFGTIHIYDAETQTLRMVARSDNIEVERDFPALSVPKGEGVISWVAVQRKALLIADLNNSPFKAVFSTVKEGVQSEIAVPIFAGEELLGVLNLESFIPAAFHPSYVKSLWFAVSQAAMVYKLSERSDINMRLRNLNKGLLELCEEWVSKTSGSFSLNKLAELATEHLDASACGIWHYNPHNHEFEKAGISPSEYIPSSPRRSGISDSVRKSKRAVWLSNIKDGNNFSTDYWIDGAWVSKSSESSGTDSSISLNSGVEAVSLLGIPITVQNKCSGVAWLEYSNAKEKLPSDEFMKLATGFAAHAGLGIEFSRVDLVDKEAVDSIGGNLSEHFLATGKLDFVEFPKLEGYVKSVPHLNSSIGGDFFAARIIDDRTACVLLGDGQGHAVSGALNMIPMLTVFETFWKESRSVTHVMDKIVSMSNKLGVRGTALYCIFSIIDNQLWLSVTSAGHDPLVIFPKDGIAEPFPPKKSPANGPMLGVPLFKSPLAEEHRGLSSGDLLILTTDGLELSLDDVSSIGLNHKKDHLSSIADAIFNRALEKRKSEPLDDDATVLIIRAT